EDGSARVSNELARRYRSRGDHRAKNFRPSRRRTAREGSECGAGQIGPGAWGLGLGPEEGGRLSAASEFCAIKAEPFRARSWPFLVLWPEPQAPRPTPLPTPLPHALASGVPHHRLHL